VIEEGLPINGTYIRIVLEIDASHLASFSLSESLILSTLFPHECKLSVMHYKI
jgi:pre-rRNA-processing protein TSR1